MKTTNSIQSNDSKNQVNNNTSAELRRAERLASDCETATLESEKDIREQTDRWTDIRTGDRVWCKHYKTMGTVTDVVTYYGSLRYHVSYDAPVRTTDRQGTKEVSDTKGGLGYLRYGITKNYDEQGEREGTALYYAEQLRYGICNSYDFVFGAVRIKTKGTHNNLKNDNKNGWGVIYEVEISDGLGEAATYTMDIMQAANLLATLYAQDKGTDPDLYKASEITDENESQEPTLYERHNITAGEREAKTKGSASYIRRQARMARCAFYSHKGARIETSIAYRNGTDDPDGMSYKVCWYDETRTGELHLVECENGISLEQAARHMADFSLLSECGLTLREILHPAA